MKCRACKFDHSPMVRCEVAARQRQRDEVVVHKPLVVHKKPEVVHIKAEVVVHKPDDEAAESRHGKYADIDARRRYRREWMAAKRAAAKAP